METPLDDHHLTVRLFEYYKLEDGNTDSFAGPYTCTMWVITITACFLIASAMKTIKGVYPLLEQG